MDENSNGPPLQIGVGESNGDIISATERLLADTAAKTTSGLFQTWESGFACKHIDDKCQCNSNRKPMSDLSTGVIRFTPKF